MWHEWNRSFIGHRGKKIVRFINLKFYIQLIIVCVLIFYSLENISLYKLWTIFCETTFQRYIFQNPNPLYCQSEIRYSKFESGNSPSLSFSDPHLLPNLLPFIFSVPFSLPAFARLFSQGWWKERWKTTPLEIAALETRGREMDDTRNRAALARGRGGRGGGAIPRRPAGRICPVRGRRYYAETSTWARIMG